MVKFLRRYLLHKRVITGGDKMSQEVVYEKRETPLTVEEEIQLGLYIDLLTGKNVNYYKKVSKAIADGFQMPVQDLVREIFKRAKVERNILIEKI